MILLLKKSDIIVSGFLVMIVGCVVKTKGIDKVPNLPIFESFQQGQTRRSFQQRWVTF